MRILRPLLVLGAACTLVVALSGQTVRVLSVTGEATLQSPGDNAPRAVKKGDTIVIGTRIITGEGSRVILTPLPGVNSIIAPKTEIVVERVSISPPRDGAAALHSAVLELRQGAVTTDLQPTEGVELDYGVRTARGLAGARGTTYTVGINAAGIQTIVVADGKITLTLADGRVLALNPGQVSITRADNTTQAVTRASELSGGDQALADNWVETTLDALAEAVEQGADIDPRALDDAARAAAELGVDVKPETQRRLDRARDTLSEKRETPQDPRARNDGGGAGDRDQSIVTERADSGFDLQAFLATRPAEQRAAYLALPDDPRLRLGGYLGRLGGFDARVSVFNYALGLDSKRLAAYLALPADALRGLLAASADPALTAYALDPYGDGQIRPASHIAYVGALTAARRAAFLSSSAPTQGLLLSRPDDAGLAAYALTPETPLGLPADQLVAYFARLSAGQRAAFRGLDQAVRSTLATTDNPVLTNYALATGRTPEQIAFAIALDPRTRLPAFVALSSTLQGKLVAANDPALTAYALDTARAPALVGFAADLLPARRAPFYALSDSAQNLLVAKALDAAFVAYALDPVSANVFRAEADILYFASLTLAQRSGFLALDPAQQSQLAAAADPGLTAYVLAAGRTPAEISYALGLPADRRALFLTYPANVKAALVAAPADTDLAAFAYATNLGGGNLNSHAAILFYANLSTSLRPLYLQRPADLRELAATDATFANLLLANYPAQGGGSVFEYSEASLRHYLLLAQTYRAGYTNYPADIRDQLAAYAKPGLTQALLDPANLGEPLTQADLRRNLAALLALSPANQALFETFAGGPAYPKLENVPGPYQWSDAAWTRTRNSYNALAPATQTRVLALGATESLFDYSSTFIDAAFVDYDATLNTTARAAVQTAGWGRYFADYFARSDIRSLFSGLAGIGAAELAALKAYDISPDSLNNHHSGNTDSPNPVDPLANLSTLAARPTGDQAVLRSLGASGDILFASLQPLPDSSVQPGYVDALDNAISFAGLFTANELSSLRRLGLARLLLRYRPSDTIQVGDTFPTAQGHLAYLLSLYNGLSPDARDIVLDSGVISGAYNELDLNSPNLASFVTAWSSLAPGTRDILSNQGGDSVNLLRLAGSGSLAALDSLLSALTAQELATLREIGAVRPLIEAADQSRLPALAEVQSFTAYISSLTDTQRFTLRELGIVRDDNARDGLFNADRDGLSRLLQAYAALPGGLRAATRQLEQYDSGSLHTGRSFFYPSDDGYDSTLYNVGFDSPGDLHVGAVRRLSLSGVNSSLGATFRVPAGKDVYLRASSLVELDNVVFSPGVRAITLEAATLNLTNLDFPEGSVLSLNSRDGGVGTGGKYPHFAPTSSETIPGRVNFIGTVANGNTVRYGGASMTDEPSFDAASRGNIRVGTLANPAPLPAYTPPSQPQP